MQINGMIFFQAKQRKISQENPIAKKLSNSFAVSRN